MLIDWLIFLIPLGFVLGLSYRNLVKPRSYGFYRLISWITILGLFARNYSYWFVHPFSPVQLVSWFLLIVSLLLIIPAVRLMKLAGSPGGEREEKEIFAFERTTRLIDTGIFSYIRHPMYGSLLYLSWGVFLKHPDWTGLLLAGLSTAALYITARLDEKICIKYFGPSYVEYMKKTTRFIPFIW